MPDVSLPRTKTEAKALGLKYYFTGKPCSRGHIAARYVSSWGCTECSRICAAANPERVRANQSRWQLAHPGLACKRSRRWYRKHLERVREGRARRYLKNKDHMMEKGRRWALANPGRVRKIKRRWALANKESVRTNTRNRRARLRNVQGTHTASDIAMLFERQKGNCAYRHWNAPGCHKTLTGGYHVDHINPLKPRSPSSKPGTNDVYNLQLLCGPCNVRKANKDPVEFAQETAGHSSGRVEVGWINAS
jgi:5-methylcytosine-specific restriction endonuclease McrA